MSLPTDAPRRGFTLCELLVVMAVIAILAAILFPVFARAQEKARQTRCLGNLEQISIALAIYARDHDGHYPPTDDDLTPLLPRYLPMEETLFCPSSGLRPSSPYLATGDPAPPSFPVVKGDYWFEAGVAPDDEPWRLVACDAVIDLHNEGANCLFVDGHAKWYQARMWGHIIPTPGDHTPDQDLRRKRGLEPPAPEVEDE